MPLFQFFCPACKQREDRFCGFSERQGQTCSICGLPIHWEFVPTLSKPVVYGNDSKEFSAFTGPKQKARYLAANSLVELGNESKDTVHKSAARARQEHEASEDAETARVVNEALSELGDAGLYKSVPKHVAEREARAAKQDDDNTGAGVR